jgi:F-type H+-transporting ATPase subunit delta
MSLLARRYATALLLAAEGRGEVDRVERELARMHAALAAPAARALITSPDVPGAHRQRALEKLAGSSELLQNLVRVTARRRRLPVLFDLHPEFRALVLAQRGEVEGVVETPLPLDDAAVGRLAELAARLSGKKVAFAVRVRPDLIGGVRLIVGNTLYDGSVKTALQQLEQRLMNAPI